MFCIWSDWIWHVNTGKANQDENESCSTAVKKTLLIKNASEGGTVCNWLETSWKKSEDSPKWRRRLVGTHSHKDMDVISSTGEAPSSANSRLDGVWEKSVEDKKDGREKKQNKNRSSGRETAGWTKLVSAHCHSGEWAGTVTVPVVCACVCVPVPVQQFETHSLF